MDKYIEALCKQNPKTKLKCGNPDCEHEFEVKSKELFKKSSYHHVCKVCGLSTEYDTTKIVKEFKTLMKKMGIIVR